MDKKERLAQIEIKLKALVEKANALENERQEALKEILRLDGQVTLLRDLLKEEKK